MGLIRSKRRVVEHGEVFTPPWLVERMLNQVKDEADRIDSRFLEPACGSGNFLVPVLDRKLQTVRRKYEKSEFELIHQAFLALMCVYGIELLEDNVSECQQNLVDRLIDFVDIDGHGELFAAANAVVATNVVHGDALTMTTSDADPIVFPEWAYLGKGVFQRRDFRFDTLTQLSAFDADTLFGSTTPPSCFQPVAIYPSMTLAEIGKGWSR